MQQFYGHHTSTCVSWLL